MTDDERLLVAAATAHRACCGSEHDPSVGKLHGCCVVCGVQWPCETASIFIDAARSQRTGAQGRDQDVSDRLLWYAIAALENCRRRCDEAGCSYDNCVWDEMKAEAESVQRARAAEKETEMEARRGE